MSAQTCRALPVLLSFVALSIPVTAEADSLTFTTFGAGGLSPAVTGISGSPFWWADTSGTTAASNVVSTGFTPFAAFSNVVDGLGAGSGGSLLLSSSFTMSASETLEVRFELLKKFFSYSNFDLAAPLGFAVLLQDGAAPVVLANITVENRDYFNNHGFLTTVPQSDTPFAPVSAGVTTTTTAGTGLDAMLNGVHYSTEPGVTGPCGCYLDVSSSYTPGAGTYQLLFGIYDFTAPGTSSTPDLFRGALAVTEVRTTPEPTTLTLLAVGSATAAIGRRQAKRRRTQTRSSVV